DEMRSHVVHTWEFLKRIPWTKEFRRIPEIARAHHEKLDGSGYPLGMKAPDIPLQSKIMAIADIYDALTAADRPYKKAVPLEQALDILDGARRMGTLDGELFDLFVSARIFDRTRPRCVGSFSRRAVGTASPSRERRRARRGGERAHGRSRWSRAGCYSCVEQWEADVRR